MDGNIDFDELDKEAERLGIKLPKVKKVPKIPPTANPFDVPKILDDEFAKLGYSPNARLALLANVGRENGWNPNTIFKGHSDPANQEFNRGIISWQKDRRTKLDNFVKNNGGDFTPNESNLRLQARFLDTEMRNSREWKSIHDRLKSPDLSLNEAYPLLQRYIKYQPRYESDNKRREAQLLKRGFTPQQIASIDFDSLDKQFQELTGRTDFDALDAQFASLGGVLPQNTVNPAIANDGKFEQNTVTDQNAQLEAFSKSGFNGSFEDWQKGQETKPAVLPSLFDKYGNPVSAIGGEDRMVEGVEIPHIEVGGIPQTPAVVATKVPVIPKQAVVPQNRQPLPVAPVQNAVPQNVPSVQTQTPVLTVQPVIPQRVETADRIPKLGDSVYNAKPQVPVPDSPEVMENFRLWLREGGLPDSDETRRQYNDLLNLTQKNAEIENQKLQGQVGQTMPIETPQTPQNTFSEISETFNYKAKDEKDFQNFLKQQTERVLLSKVPNATGADVDEVLKSSTWKTRYHPDLETVEVTVPETLQKAVAIERDKRIWLDGKTKLVAERVKNGESKLDAMFQEGLLTPEQYSTAKYEQQQQEEKDAPYRQNYLKDKEKQAYLRAYSGQTDLEQDLKESREIGNSEIADLLKEYGSVENYYKDRKEMWTRIAKNPNSAALEFTKNLTRAVPKSLSSLSKAVSIGAEGIDYLIGGDETAATDRGFFQLGKWIDRKVDEFLPQDKQLSKAFILNAVPDALGQLFVQLGAGILTGGVATPLLIGASMGGAGQYEEVDKMGATKGQKLLASLTGAAAAVPDVLLQARWLKMLSPGEQAGFLGKLTNSIFGKTAAELGEAEARTATQTLIRNMLAGGLFEGTQELSENKINDFVASLTYDKKRKVLTINGRDLESFFAGFIAGGVGGGVVSLGTGTMPETAEPELSEDAIEEAWKQEAANRVNEIAQPEQTVTPETSVSPLNPKGFDKVETKETVIPETPKPATSALNPQGFDKVEPNEIPQQPVPEILPEAEVNQAETEVAETPKSEDAVIANLETKLTELKSQPQSPKRDTQIALVERKIARRKAILEADKSVEQVPTAEVAPRSEKFDKVETETSRPISDKLNEVAFESAKKQPFEMTDRELRQYDDSLGYENGVSKRIIQERQSLEQKYGKDYRQIPTYELTQSEYVNAERTQRYDLETAQEDHKNIVEEALESGQTVSPSVLADYPDLAKKYAESQAALPRSESDVPKGESAKAKVAEQVNVPVAKLPYEMKKDEFSYKYGQSHRTEVNGYKITELTPEQQKNVLNYNGEPTITVYRGVDEGTVKDRPLESGDYVTMDEETALQYGKKVLKQEIPVEKLRYIRGRFDGNPKDLDQNGRVELIYVDKENKFHKKYPKDHYSYVEKALKEGKTVPDEVLKDYPDLVEKYATPLSPTQKAELRRKKGVSEDELGKAGVQPLGEKGSYGQTVYKLRQEMYKADSPLLSDLVKTFAPEIDTSAKNAGDAVLDAISESVGKTRSSQLSPADWNRILDSNAHKLSLESVAKIEEALLHQSDWEGRRDAFFADRTLLKFLGDVGGEIDSGKITSFSSLKPISKKAIISIGKNKYGLSEQTIKDSFNTALSRYLERGDGEGRGIEKGESAEKESRTSPTQIEIDKPHYALANPTFYSQLERTIEAKMPSKASAVQVRGIINNPQTGIKKEELEWTGINEWLEGKDKVTKEEVLDFIRENNVDVQEVVKEDAPKSFYIDNGEGKILADGFATHAEAETRAKEIEAETGNDVFINRHKESDQTKFSNYQLEGEKQNYRELLLTMPPKAIERPVHPQAKRLLELKSKMGSDGFTDAEQDELNRLNDDIYNWEKENKEKIAEYNRYKDNPKDVYKSSHFDEPNILAHIRFNERKVDGKRVLFIEEIQSDWGQEGRKKGFRGDWDKLTDEQKTIAQNYQDARPSEREAILKEYPKVKEWSDARSADTPNFPFKKSWQELAFKRALHWATSNGFDEIAWTSGEQQNARYDLSKQVESVMLTSDGELLITPKGKDRYESLKKGVKESELSDYIGKEPAEKLINATPNPRGDKFISGLDLKIGGEGMKGFYDKILPSFVNKYVKKWGGRVGELKLPTENIKDSADERLASQRWLESHPDLPASMNPYGARSKTESVHSVSITPQMRESVNQGQPLYNLPPRDQRLYNEIGKELSKLSEEFRQLSDTGSKNAFVKRMLDNSVIKVRGNEIFLNPEANELLRQAHEAKFGSSPDAILGAYQNPYINGDIIDALYYQVLGNFRTSRSAFVKKFEDAVDPKFNDTRIIATNSKGQYIRAARQEENLHQIDFRDLAEHSVSINVIPKNKVGQKAMQNLKQGAYSTDSPTRLAIEVGAKIWTDTDELGLTAEEKLELQDAIIDAAYDAGIPIEDVINSISKVSKTGKEYARKRTESDTTRDSGDGGQINAGTATKDGRKVSSEIRGTGEGKTADKKLDKPSYAAATPQTSLAKKIFSQIYEGRGADATPKKEVMVNFRRSGLLTSPKTHLRNIISNAAFQASEEAMRPVALLADLAASALSGRRTVQAPSLPGIAKSFKALVKADKTMEALNQESGIKRAWGILKNGDTKELAKNQLAEMKSGSPLVDKFVNATFRALGAEDALFKTYALRRSLEEQAKSLAISKSRNITFNNYSTRRAWIAAQRQHLLENPTKEMLMEGMLYADFATFTNQNPISDIFRKVKDINPTLKAGLELAVPYDKTPTNIILRTLEYSPAGFVMAGKHLLDWKKGNSYTISQLRRGIEEQWEGLDKNRQIARTRIDSILETLTEDGAKLEEEIGKLESKSRTATEDARLKKLKQNLVVVKKKISTYGKIISRRGVKDSFRDQDRKEIEKAIDNLFPRLQQQQFAKSFGRAGFGSAALALGIVLAMRGLLSGVWDAEEPDEKKEHYKRKDEGILDGSLQLGNRRYQIIDSPLGKTMAAGASIWERSQQDLKKGQTRGGKLASDTADVTGSILAQQPLLDAYFTGNKSVDQRIGDLLGSFVPAIINDLADLSDDKKRETKSLLDYPAARIPFLRQQLPEAEYDREPYLRDGLNRLINRFDPLNSRPVTEQAPSSMQLLRDADDAKSMVEIVDNAEEDERKRLIPILRKRAREAKNQTDKELLEKTIQKYIEAEKKARELRKQGVVVAN